MLVANWMTRTPITIRETDPVPTAMRLMKEHQIRRLPVMRDDRLAGILTDRDIREFLPSKATDLEAHELHYIVQKTLVSAVMKSHVVTVSPSTTLEQAAAMMRRLKIGGFPVVEDGRLVGVITESDIFEALVELLGEMESGARVTVELGSSATALNDVLDTIRRFSPQLICALTYSREDLPRSRGLVLKLKITRRELDGLLEHLDSSGLSVTDARYGDEKVSSVHCAAKEPGASECHQVLGKKFDRPGIR